MSFVNRIQKAQLGTTVDLSQKYMFNTVTEIPMVRISIIPGTVWYEDQQPLIAPDGGIIPETRPREWAQLYQAGKIV